VRVHHVGIQTNADNYIDRMIQTTDFGVDANIQTLQTSEDLLNQRFSHYYNEAIFDAYQEAIAQADNHIVTVSVLNTPTVSNMAIQTDAPTNSFSDIAIQTQSDDELSLHTNVDVNITIHDDIIYDLMQAANNLQISMNEIDIFNSIRKLIAKGSMNDELSSITFVKPESFQRTYITNEWYQENKASILNWISNQRSNQTSSASSSVSSHVSHNPNLASKASREWMHQVQ
jgi:isopentenyldiphosphate isomerase